MKRLIIILLALSIVVKSQDIKNTGWRVTALYTTSIVLNAIGDGMIADNNHQVLAHSLRAGSIGCLLAVPFVTDIRKDKWYWYLASYTTIRIGLFDPIYNVTRGLPIHQTHNVSLWDKSVKSLNSPDGLGYLTRGTFFIVGFSIPINQRL